LAPESGNGVTVTRGADGWEFTPQGVEPTAGLVFYPGGHVDARSYAPYAREVAKRGYLVVVPVMPLSLAVLAPNVAHRVLVAHPGIRRWALGGHSLGGVMAAQYAGKNLDRVQGLVLLASYAARGTDLTGSRLAVASLLGTQDMVINRQAWQAGKALLPTATAYVTLDGGNHGQFGDYEVQPGDTPDPRMSAAEQRRIATDATVTVLRRAPYAP
jgi:dienelactone hydrolase